MVSMQSYEVAYRCIGASTGCDSAATGSSGESPRCGAAQIQAATPHLMRARHHDRSLSHPPLDAARRIVSDDQVPASLAAGDIATPENRPFRSTL
jgi:hypothetical protein